MTLRSTKLHLAAAVLALGLMTLSGPSARAFTMENLSGGGSADGSSRYADPDSQVKNGYAPFGQGGPTVQFGGSTGSSFSPLRPFNGFASPSQPPPDPYNLNNRN